MDIFLKSGLSFMCKNLCLSVYIKCTDNELEVNHLSLLDLSGMILCRMVSKQWLLPFGGKKKNKQQTKPKPQQWLLPSEVLAVALFSGNLNILNEAPYLVTPRKLGCVMLVLQLN